MNLYANILLCIIFITYPLLLFLFYVAYNRNLCTEEKDLFLDVALISSFYLIIKFANTIWSDVPPIIFNATLVIAYLKKRNITILLLSFLSAIFYINHFDLNVYLIITEYIIYFIIYLILKKKDYFADCYINLFIIVKAIFFTLEGIINIEGNYLDFLAKAIILVLMLYLTIYFTTILFEKGEEIIKYHMSIKELEQEKQIRVSLFKITHEIKNPIAVCKGYLDMFDTSNPLHSVKYIPILREEIERVLLLLQDFLSMTKVNIESYEMDIYLLLDDVIDDFKPILKNMNINLINDIPDSELYIDGDYNRLKQVFINILKNSVEAIGDKKAGEIKIYSKIIENEVKIYIEDNGIGMSSEVLSKINEPFFTTKKNGTGLGTSLSSEIIKAHKGQINYYSKLDIGTKVEIILKILNMPDI